MTSPYSDTGWLAAGIRPSKADRIVPPSDPVDRDPCPRCGIRNDIGCKHTVKNVTCKQLDAGGIESPMRDLSFLVRVLNRIECPSARKSVIMSKRERGQITDVETEHLIRACDVVHA